MLHSDSPVARNVPGVPPSVALLKAILRRMLSCSKFWLAAAALSATTALKRSLELLVALYFFDTSSHVSQVGGGRRWLVGSR